MITICVPAYNADRYLAETLDSVRSQIFADWELILVEDGSKDRAEEMLNAFASQVRQSVRYVRHEKNAGLPVTRNTAIASARTEWIALLDSDDLWTSEHLNTLVKCSRSTGADLVHAGSQLFDSDTGRDLEIRAPTPEAIADFPLSLFDNRYIIQPASVMLKRSLWQRVGGFNPAFRYVEDREMWLRCARAGGRFAYSGLETCRYRKHASALSTHAAAMAEAAAAVFDQHLDWAELPKALRVRLASETWAAAGKLRQRKDPRTASRHFGRACALRWRPDWQLRAWVFQVIGTLRPVKPV